MYPDKEWDWDGLSQNKKLHINWIEKYKEKPWCWGCIHDNDTFYNNFNLNILDKVADIANFETLSLFKKVSFEWLEKYPDKPWNYEIISLNSDEYYLYHCRRYMAAYRIQQYWYKITISPEYKLGRKFIERKYDKLYA